MKYGAEIDRIVRRMTDREDKEWAMNLDAWDWVPGIGMYGVARAWRMTDNPEYGAFIEAWIHKHIAAADGVKTINSFAPMLTVLEWTIKSGNDTYMEVCERTAQWMLRSAERTETGAFEHTVTENVTFPGQSWADTLFMACIFLARYGNLTDNEEMKAFAANQLALHYRLLDQPESGLFYHGWDGAAGNHMSGACWGRANAWIIAATCEILEELESFPERNQILERMARHAEALRRVQTESGAFRTVLDDPDSYEETSAAAGIAYGFLRGVKDGYLPKEYIAPAEKAVAFVLKQTEPDGTVLGVSGGTPVMPTKADYNKIPVVPTLYGQALAILALCEV